MARHTKVITRSFAGGEMSPEMFSRSDDVMFQAGAATLLNCIPRPTGAVARRPGTQMIRQTREAGQAVHLFSFVFSQTQSVVIEASRATMGGVEGGYFRFHTNGGTLLYSHPHRLKSSVLTGAGSHFAPFRTVSCSGLGGPMVVTLNGHGLATDDVVQFVGSSRTVPDHGEPARDSKPKSYTAYYVQKIDANSFTLKWKKPPAGPLVPITMLKHAGYYPVLYNWGKWLSSSTDLRALQNILISEHRIQNTEPVVITMWPDGKSPTVKFLNEWPQGVFRSSQVGGGYNIGLATTPKVAQQVMFVASDFGGTLPSKIEEGRLYWVTEYVKGTPPIRAKWRISETFNGPTITSLGTRGKGIIKMCVMPELLGGSLGSQGRFGCMTRYYAIVDPDAPNVLRLETSIGTGQVVNGGLSFNPRAQGCGPFRYHRVHEPGDIVSYYDAAGGLRMFYSQKSWFNPEFGGDRDVLTEDIHKSASSLSPGSGSDRRDSAKKAAYWRELPGRTTGDAFVVTANEYGSGTDLTFTSSEAHGLSTGMAVSLAGGERPRPLDMPHIYYAVVDNPTSFRLATTKIRADGVDSNPHDHAINGPDLASPKHGGLLMEAFVAFDTTADVVVWPSHGLENGDTVIFSSGWSDIIGGALTNQHLSNGTRGLTKTHLQFNTVYYVREETTDTFRISETSVGALLVFDPTGSEGTFVTACGNSIYEVPHDYSADELPKISTTQSGDVMTMASQDHPVSELRRLSSTKWEMVEVKLSAGIDAPGPIFEVELSPGEGTTLVSATLDTTLDHWHWNVGNSTRHGFEEGNPVYVDGLERRDTTNKDGYLRDGYYIVDYPSSKEGFESRIYFKSVDSGEKISTVHSSSGLKGRIRYGTQGEDRSQVYVVTAINENNEESVPNDEYSFSNNVFVSGAYNVLGWSGANKAVRYRIYKKINGLFGIIGETEELEFKDDNIGPDLSASPPIEDVSMRKQARVTFELASNLVVNVSWTDHGLQVGTPVVFRTTGEMPGVEEGKTYYVSYNGLHDFQISTSPSSGVFLVAYSGNNTGLHVGVAGNFPSTATYFEGRRVFGGSRTQPQDIWMTASGTEGDMTYSIPTVDSDRIYFRIASREISSIRHLIPLQQLVMLSESTEYRLTPMNDDVVTPSSISVRPQSFVGADFAQPSLVNNTVVFAAARGGHMREMGYNRDVLGYMTGDLSIRAAHLFDGLTIIDQAYSKAPLPVVWCVSSSGKLLGLTYIPEENVGAWHQHTTPGGLFESVTVVPEGVEDAVYVVVNRGGTRYVERFANEFRGETVDLPDAFFVDCGLTYQGIETTTISGLDHLNGPVSFLADGVAGTGTVSSGALTLAKAASRVHVGLSFTMKIETLPLTMMKVDAFGTGKTKNVNQVWVRAFQSGAFESGPSSMNQEKSATVTAHTDNTFTWGGFNAVTPWLYFPSAHGLSDGDEVVFTGTTAPGGLTFGTTYYVRTSGMPITAAGEPSKFRVSATPTGSLIEFIDSYGSNITAIAKSVSLRTSSTPSAGLLLTDLVRVTLPASWDDDGQIVIQQSTPLPLTVSGLTIEVASGG